MNFKFSDKQRDVYNALLDPECEYVITYGATRSGKTTSTALSFIEAARQWNPREESRKRDKYIEPRPFGLAALSIKQYYNNIVRVFNLYKNLKPSCQMIHKGTKSESIHIKNYHGDWVEFSRELGKESTSETKLLGQGYQGFYFDEAVDLDIDFIRQTENRCDQDGRMFCFTMNPKQPTHPFRMEFIEAVENNIKPGKVFHFGVEDNPSLSENTKKFLLTKDAHNPVRHQRFALGNWYAAEGQVYPFWKSCQGVAPLEEPQKLLVVIDPSTANKTHACLFGYYGENNFWCLDEWVNNGKWSPMLVREQLLGIYEKFTEYGKIDKWVCDPKAVELRLELEKSMKIQPVLAYNDVEAGIGVSSDYMNDKHLQIDMRCKETAKCLDNYSYDEVKSLKANKDVPEKGAGWDDGADVIRYFCATHRYYKGKNRQRYAWKV